MARKVPGSVCASAFMLLATGSLQAQQPACTELNAPATPSYDFLGTLSRWGSKNGYGADAGLHLVNSIAVNTLPIFDESNPREDNFLFRWANAIHITTRPKVITDQLLFKESQWVDDRTLAESERILRTRQYVGDAAIRVLRQCGEAVDLEVVSREVWTLTPEVSFKSTGGHSSSAIGIRDSNILGTGQFVDLKYKRDQERSSWGVAYQNPNIGGSHAQFATEFTNNSDGHHYVVEAAQPFYSLDDKHSWHVAWESTDEILNQYAFGQRVNSLDHSIKQVDVSYGVSEGRVNGEVRRLSGGVHASRQQWSPTAVLPPPPGYVQSLDLYYPYLQYDYIEDGFVTGYNIGQIRRTEDINLGLHWRTRLGYAGGAGGNVIFEGDAGDTLLYRPGMLLRVSGNWEARWSRERSRLEDSTLKAALDYQVELSDRRTLFLGLSANKLYHLNNGKQLELGGSNGLRGYDTHFLNGTGSVQFTAEQRYFTDYHWLQLARVGFAMFYDAGRIWGNANPAAGRMYQDVGFGLRLAPSRSESGQVVHIDIAWPIRTDVPGGTAGRQFAIELKNTF